MNYTELKNKIIEEISAFPMKFAFSDKQLKEGLESLGAAVDDVVSIGGGGFVRKTDVNALNEMFNNHEKLREDALKDRDFLIDALVYELGNHEYCITHDPEPALNALGIEAEDVNDHVRECYKEAKRIYLESVEVTA